ncbi:MAG: ribose ABC transporter permease [Anaerolineae bacterium]|jgi:ribose/xylose/arabinose/galactoside ABC-type transport system permease subunit|nr:ribose ABC transporter permease [Anaerolineae bacterium]MDH7475544.1 ribose ABC transporter permease [Anaerolineae bacterium]
MQTRPRTVELRELLRRYSVVLILLALCVALTLLSKSFLTASNLLNVALQTSIVAIVAIGMTFTILTGGIDLSVGSVVALCGALAAGWVVRDGMNTYLAIGLALLIGCALGTISGLLIVKGNIPPFVATLSVMAIGRGLTLVYTQGKPIAGMDEDFVFWGTGKVGPIPVPVLILVLALAAAYVVLTRTRFGLYVYAIGGNEETARLAGIKTERIKIAVYVISGFTAALTGVLLTARLWSAQPTAGVGLELDAIAAPVLGGTSLFGGVGSVGGTLVGAFIMGVLSNGLNLLEISAYYQRVIKGVVFILAVMLDLYTKRRRR